MKAEVTRRGVLSMQVCVPKSWTDEEATNFANEENPCGTSAGWTIRTDIKLLSGDPCRNQCDNNKDNVHITLDAWYIHKGER